jgi:hypothetical protein
MRTILCPNVPVAVNAETQICAIHLFLDDDRQRLGAAKALKYAIVHWEQQNMHI